MVWDPNLQKIRDILIKLYDDPLMARTVANEVGIPKEVIPHYPTTFQTWHSIISEAKNRGEKQIENLVQHGIKNFESEELIAAYKEYLAGITRRHHPYAPNIGVKRYLTCDRKKHESAFNFYFDDFLRKRQVGPQVYIIPGDENQRHDSLIERLATRIVDHVKGQPQFGVDHAPVPKWKVNIDAGDDVLESEKIFFYDLFNQGQQRSNKATTPSCEEFSQLLKRSLCPAVVIQHNIKIAEWNKNGSRLLETYLKFLDKLECDESTPLIVVFFCIIYPVPSPSRFPNFIPLFWKRGQNQYEKDLPKLFQLERQTETARWVRQSPPCVLLDPLGCVKYEDVLDWFESANFADDQINTLRLASRIVGEKECKSMKEVETALTDILLELYKERGDIEMTRGQ